MIDKMNHKFICLADHVMNRADAQNEDENYLDNESNKAKREQTRTGSRKEEQQPRQMHGRN